MRSRVEGEIGYVRITSFTEQTDAGLRTAIQRMREQLGPKFKGLVLDMRNNPGGLLDQAVAVSDAFLERGEIVSTRGRRSGWRARAPTRQTTRRQSGERRGVRILVLMLRTSRHVLNL